MKRFCFLLCILPLFMHASDSLIYLHTNWQVHKAGNPQWIKASVPGTVHTDLMDAQILSDPFLGDNEEKALWVNDCDWEYKTHFQDGFDYDDVHPIYLQFDGLDTYADVYLNNQLILQAANMFRTYTIDITKQLLPDNELRIYFHSATKMADSLAKLALPFVRPCENNRHYIRKAQYHFGWDWAPKLTTCGIWRSVKLIAQKEKPSKAVYSKVKLVQEKDNIGRSFYFTVDGKPTFMRGANWIPADVFLPRITKEKYRSLLLAAKEANFNMLRVWGGGIYEEDAFYDLCDSLGIYVWQDFMFAGAMYPATEDFINNVKQEAIDNILRLRKHKCIVLWCGNNEIDEAWHNWGWQKQFHLHDEDSIRCWKEYQTLFQEILPALVKQYDPERDYIASSPLYGWGRQESMTQGDSHYWGMWWGLEPIDMMRIKIPRFMSEFGMQALPVKESIMQYASTNDLDTNSLVMRVHQKHPTGYSTINRYLNMEHIAYTDFDSYIEATQSLQSKALAWTINAQLHSKGRCMGSLIWQFNDCWPVCSWSLIDYYGRKKKAYDTIKSIYKQQP